MTAAAVPRLRAVEAFPVEHDGQRLIGLRDPSGYASGVPLLPPVVVEIVALLDGTRTVLDLQAGLMERHGALVPRDDIERVIEVLDARGFLDSDRFRTRRAEVDRAFLASPRRPAGHAGMAYPGEPAALREAMDGFFAGAEGPGAIRWMPAREPAVRGLIVPHIDFGRGGPAYAWGYRELAERADADLFVVLGTCHAGMSHPFGLTRKDHDTPLGPVPVDRDVVEAIAARAGQDCFAAERAHRVEHSIEFQAVFLRYLYAGRRDVTIVPVLASFAHEALARGREPEDDPRVPRFLDAVRRALDDSGRRAVVIAGADLAHVGPRFGDHAPLTPEAMAAVEREDRAMLAAAVRDGAAGFFG